jgi:putative phosphoribosyl transferase
VTAVQIDLGAGVRLDGELDVPAHAPGIVVFAHGSGSSRLSPRNRHVAALLREGGLGTLLFDLLTADEETVDRITRHLRFDIGLLATRLAGATRWLAGREEAAGLPCGYFGASTGAAAALVAAAEPDAKVAAVVSRGGRPDLADERLASVRAPTLLVVGERDREVLVLNREAQAAMTTETALEIVPGATHLFEEPGTLDHAARLARDWFLRWFGAQARSAS